MIALIGASAIYLSALQASIAAPTTAFRGCLHDATTKATTEKVSADSIDTYLRGACTVQMKSLTDAIVAFRMKNGMTRKQAENDASMTVDDYVSTPADNYKFMAGENAPKAQPAAVATPAAQAKAAVQPASTQPHS